MNSLDKLFAFEYVVKRIIDWFNEVNAGKNLDPFNEFSKLKLIKLHFFVSAVNANTDQEGLLYKFDNFYALPYGHVESDIYKALPNTTIYEINNDSISIKDNLNLGSAFLGLETQLKLDIDNSIDHLKKINPDLVNYSAFDLVELSHKWYSWRSTFEEAKKTGRFSAPIAPKTIKLEPKFFN